MLCLLAQSDESGHGLFLRLSLPACVTSPNRFADVIDRAEIVPLRFFLGAVAALDLHLGAQDLVEDLGPDGDAAGLLEDPPLPVHAIVLLEGALELRIGDFGKLVPVQLGVDCLWGIQRAVIFSLSSAALGKTETAHLLLFHGFLLLWRQQRLPSELVLELRERVDAVNVEEIGEVGALSCWFGVGMRSGPLESIQ